MTGKFLLISQVFYPDEVSTANLFTNLCAVLVEEQVDVEVWCAQPSYTHRGKQPRKTVHKGISILFLPSTGFPKTSFTGRLINYLTFAMSVAWKLLFSKDKTPVFTHTTPPSLGIMISFLCSLRRRNFNYILLDIFPDGLIRLGKVSAQNVFIRIWKKLKIASLKRSSRIIVIGRDMKQWLASVYHDGIYKTVNISLWQDENLIQPASLDSSSIVRDYQLTNRFIVQYSGNMGLWNEMETIGKAVKRNPDGITFVFVGGGMRRSELLRNFSEEEQTNVLFFPFQPNEKLSVMLTSCHVGLVSMKKGLEGIAVPSKIFGIMAAGIPVIALVPEESEIACIIREENCGLVVDPNDVDGLIHAIDTLKLNEKRRIEMGMNGRIAFEKKYTTRIIAQEYKSLILSE
ncbi:MAG: glycosyltransferase family 4 protein [Bacteroidales bacterium]|nr:MAG: glycosyltransferase family 4 protein [Bacteroidales bacterium]